MKCVFFDRDGTLNVDKDYLYRIEDFQWVPEAVEALQYLKERGYVFFVVTNQSGIARGYYQEEDMHRLHAYMNEQLAKHGLKIEKFYFCPHHPKGPVKKYMVDCSCRKPKSGMLEQCFAQYDVDKEHSLLIGDKDRDLEAGEAVGIRGYKYEGGSLLDFVKTLPGLD